jgi:ADP-ribose pyrophosphatase YjhB (NUDIX family)
MKLLENIGDEGLGVVKKSCLIRDRVTRLAARAIVVDSEGKIAVLHMRKKNQYKLPGGGIDEEESIHQGLLREVKEEAGCEVEIEKELGMVIEERDDKEEELGLFQISFCFLCKVAGEKCEPQFTKKEIKNGFELKWMTPEEALGLNSQIKHERYKSKFIQHRFNIIVEAHTQCQV